MLAYVVVLYSNPFNKLGAFLMSDWADFCETMKIDPNEPDQFDQLLEQWSKDERGTTDVRFRNVDLRAFLRTLANPGCEKCDGTGYIDRYKAVEGGRCFECLPDSRWNKLVAE